MRRRALLPLLASLLLVALSATAVPAEGEGLELPNLVPVSTAFQIDSMGRLAFNTAVRNHGGYSFEVLGTPDEQNQELIAQQCVTWADEPVAGSPRACQEHREIGRLVWHREHNHLHLDGLATYALHQDEDGAPGERVRFSEKVGFCLTDTYRHRGEPSPVHVHPLADPLLDDRWRWQQELTQQWYVECRFLYGTGVPWPGLRMGISGGYADVYYAGTPGQEFPIDGLADGTYWLRTVLNASGVVHVLETDLTDNEHWAPLCLGTSPAGTRTVRGGVCPA